MNIEPHLIVFKLNSSSQVVDQVITFLRRSNSMSKTVGNANLEINLGDRRIWLITFDRALAEKLRKHPAIAHVGGIHFRQRNTRVSKVICVQ